MNPALGERIGSLLQAVEDETGERQEADAAELRLIDEMRQRGRESLEAWARGQERVVTDLAADVPFSQAMDKLVEPRGVLLSESTIRRMTEGPAQQLLETRELCQGWPQQPGCVAPQRLPPDLFARPGTCLRIGAGEKHWRRFGDCTQGGQGLRGSRSFLLHPSQRVAPTVDRGQSTPGPAKKRVTVKNGDDLFALSNPREICRDGSRRWHTCDRLTLCDRSRR